MVELPPGQALLRAATVVAFCSVAGAMALQTAAIARQRAVFVRYWNEEIADSEMVAADDAVAMVVLAVVGMMLVATVLVSIWSLRAARHARDAGDKAVSPRSLWWLVHPLRECCHSLRSASLHCRSSLTTYPLD